MKSEAVSYSAGSLNCRGQLIYNETVSGQPLLLMAPNWLGVTAAERKPAAARPRAGQGLERTFLRRDGAG